MHIRPQSRLWQLLTISALTIASALNAKTSTPLVVRTSHTYKLSGQIELLAHVTAPKEAASQRPCLIFYHGGGWTGGRPVVFNEQANYLASRGIIVIQPAYRLLSKKPAADGSLQTPEICIQDAKSAYRWVVENAEKLGVDPTRIAVGGASAGGHLAAAICLIDGHDDPDDNLSIAVTPKAQILINPVIDNGPGGYGYSRIKEQYPSFSPLHNTKATAPPTLILTGSEDRHVPVSMIQTFTQKLEDANVRCDTLIYKGHKHSFYSRSVGGPEAFNEVIYQIDIFLNSLGWLSGKPTIAKPESMHLCSDH